MLLVMMSSLSQTDSTKKRLNPFSVTRLSYKRRRRARVVFVASNTAT